MATHQLSPFLVSSYRFRPQNNSASRGSVLLNFIFLPLVLVQGPQALILLLVPRQRKKGSLSSVPGMAASQCFPGVTKNTDQYLTKPCPLGVVRGVHHRLFSLF
ncbi:hypothetical protein CHARACLAT_002533, partial [Characodon lateralis]|nr:hypothetical protein [Characodon lateralis]